MMKFDNTYSELPLDFYEVLKETNSFEPKILAFNEKLAHSLGINVRSINQEKLAKILSGNEFPEGSNPIAMAYAGHQFGHFSPQLGDGRAMLLGEIISPEEKRYDIHLKGSGPTKFSRRGDGKSALGPVIREYLVSEGMFFLGISTTRSLAAVRSGESVYRDGLIPGGVLTRVALSHIRVGTFEYFARRGDIKNLKILTDYTINRLYPGLNYFEFWCEVAQRQIDLVLNWMKVGFIHGVMNTDNTAISGETIDYGPCAFMDNFQFNKVFSSIDQNGRYAFSNQPHILLWNLTRLAECLIPLFETKENAIEDFTHKLEELEKSMPSRFYQTFTEKFGLESVKENDSELIASWFELLEKNDLDFTLSYIDLERLFERKKPFSLLEESSGFSDFFDKLQKRIQDEGSSTSNVIKQMQKVNPFTIPRNHLVEEAIQMGNQGDDSFFFGFLEAIQDPFKRSEKLNSFQGTPEIHERVLKTFCGT